MNALDISQIPLYPDSDIVGLMTSLPMLCRMSYGWELAVVSSWEGDTTREFHALSCCQHDLEPEHVLDWAYCERLLTLPGQGE